MRGRLTSRAYQPDGKLVIPRVALGRFAAQKVPRVDGRAPKARSALLSFPRVRPLHVRYTPRHSQKDKKSANSIL